LFQWNMNAKINQAGRWINRIFRKSINTLQVILMFVLVNKNIGTSIHLSASTPKHLCVRGFQIQQLVINYDLHWQPPKHLEINVVSNFPVLLRSHEYLIWFLDNKHFSVCGHLYPNGLCTFIAVAIYGAIEIFSNMLNSSIVIL